MNIQGWQIAIIVALAVLLFGAPKLPGLARSVGQSLRIFKSEVKQMKDESNADEAAPDPVEGRVVNNSQQPQSYSAAHQAPVVHPEQSQVPTPTAPHSREDGPVDGPSQAGPSQQSGTSHSSK